MFFSDTTIRQRLAALVERVILILLCCLVTTTANARDMYWVYDSNNRVLTNTLERFDVTYTARERLVGVGGQAIVVSTDGGRSWIQTGFLAFTPRALAFADEQYGCVVGDRGRILTTDLAGVEWHEQPSGTAQDLTDVSWPALSTLVAVGESGTVLRSTDRGSTWTRINIGTNERLSHVDFGSGDNGLMQSASGTVYRSTDGGQTWHTIPRPPASWDIADAQTVFAFDGVHVHKSTDIGDTWSMLPQAVGVGDARMITFKDAQVGIVRSVLTHCCGATWGTTDGGLTWVQWPTSPGGGINGYTIYDKNTVLMRFREHTLVTHDFGQTIEELSTPPTTGPLWNDVAFIDDLNGIVLGEDEILRTSDGGLNWSAQPSPTLSEVVFVNPDVGIAVGEEHYARSTDGGRTWSYTTPMSNGTVAGISDISAPTPDVAFIVSSESDEILRTVDAGAQWDAILQGSDADPIYDVFFVDPSTGYVLTEDNVHVTLDGGEAWDTHPHPMFHPRALWVIDAEDALMVGRFGKIRRTNDGGRTWTVREDVTNTFLEDITFRPDNRLIGTMFSSAHVMVSDDLGGTWTVPSYFMSVYSGYTIKGIDTSGRAVGFWVGGNVLLTPVPPPSTLPFTEITSFTATPLITRVELAWQIRSIDLLRDVQLRRSDGQVVSVATTGSFVDENLSPESAYEYTLVAMNAYAPDVYSAPLNVTTHRTPSILELAGSSEQSPHQIKITWTVDQLEVVEGFYLIKASSGLQPQRIPSTGLLEAPTNMHLDPGLSSNRVYQYTFVVVPKEGEEIHASPLVVSTNPFPSVTRLEANTDGLDIVLSWDMSGADAVQNILLARNDAPAEPIALPPDTRKYRDTDVEVGTRYRYVLQLEIWGGGTVSSASVEATLALPTRSSLGQNHPNPFNPTTTIPFAIARKGEVTVEIFDVRGRHVRTLIRTIKDPGYHDTVWDGRSDGGDAVASGVYLYRLQTPSFSQTKKLVLVR